MKLKILICDDVAQHRKWMKAALVNAPITTNEQKRIDLANELFDIHEFEIVGDAIKALEGGLKVDLGLADADFCNLPSEYIVDKGFNVLTEKTSLRGFDLLEAMKKHLPETPAFLFTGYAANKIDIYQEIIKRELSLGKDWFFKPMDKGYGIEILTEEMPFPLKKAAERIFDGLAHKNKIGFRSILESVPESALLDCTFDIDGRKMGIKNLLMGWSRVEVGEDGNLVLIIDDVKTRLEKLINFKQTDDFKPVGIWKGGLQGKKDPKDYTYMVTARTDYQHNVKYSEWKENINTKSAQLILELCEQFMSGKKKSHYLFSVKVDGYNCLHESENITIDDDIFRGRFFNALICRRFVIGLCKLRDGRKTPFKEGSVVDLAGESIGRTSGFKEFLNTILGLRGVTNAYIQQVKYESPFIMSEEIDWLKKYIPLVEERLRKGDWRSFVE
jgi:CheY-like chemotaxis protein